jgi:two-component system OmpR family response regulator
MGSERYCLTSRLCDPQRSEEALQHWRYNRLTRQQREVATVTIMEAGQARIAVVEDDTDIRELVTEYLAEQGFEVFPCRHGGDLDALLATTSVDLLVLDLMMPGEDGLSICRRLTAHRVQAPRVIILSGRGDDVDRIVGLEVGADDYLPKPFNPRELTARIRAVLRRSDLHDNNPTGGDSATSTLTAPDGAGASARLSAPGPPREVYRFAGWELDVSAHVLLGPDGRMVLLSGGEFALLVAFVRHPRRVLSRDQLLDWTRGDASAPVDRAIDVQLSRLRRKLGDSPRDPALIKTVRGGGYLWAVDVERA